MEKVRVTGWEWESGEDSESHWVSVTLTVQVLGHLGRYHTHRVELPASLLVEFLSLINPIETSEAPQPSPEGMGSGGSADSQDPH
jgi:hypothetical protein